MTVAHRRRLVEVFGFVGVFAVSFVFSYGSDPLDMALLPALVVSVGAAALVLWSFHRPVAAFVGALVLTAALPFLDSTFEVMSLVLALIGFRVVADTRVHWGAVGAPLFVALTVNDLWLRRAFDRELSDPTVLFPLLLTGLVIYTGLQSRRLRDQRDRLLALQEADRRRAVLEERRRIALDLHDVAAHHLSALVVRSRLTAKVDTPESYRELAAFSASTASEALDSIRHVVEVLHDDETPMTPQPDLHDLTTVLDRLSAAGLEVERGGETPPDLPRHVEGALVRIVQEALSNVLQHRGPGRAWMVLGHCDGAATLLVEDDGPSSPPDHARPRRPGARGLSGMVERAESCGGRLDIGASSRGGWAVRARIPISSPSP
jgi:signal transduction histidine kinase